MTAFGTTGCQYPTSVMSGHPFPETVFVSSFPVRRLIGLFHIAMYLIPFAGLKTSLFFFETAKVKKKIDYANNIPASINKISIDTSLWQLWVKQAGVMKL